VLLAALRLVLASAKQRVMDSITTLRAQLATPPVPVLLAALRLRIACAQRTRMEMMRMEHARIVAMVVPLLLKQNLLQQPQLLIARVW
jgi:hypothetical protein